MYLTPADLVWHKEGGSTYSAGYKVDSLFKSHGISPMTTLNKPMKGGAAEALEQSGGEKFSDLFRFMGIPAGLSNLVSAGVEQDQAAAELVDVQREEGGLIKDSLFEKLISLAGPEPNIQNGGTRSVVSSSDNDEELTGGASVKKSPRKSVTNQSGKRRRTRRVKKAKVDKPIGSDKKKVKTTRRKR